MYIYHFFTSQFNILFNSFECMKLKKTIRYCIVNALILGFFPQFCFLLLMDLDVYI